MERWSKVRIFSLKKISSALLHLIFKLISQGSNIENQVVRCDSNFKLFSFILPFPTWINQCRGYG